MNLLNISALKIAEKIAGKEITCSDVTAFYIERIKTHNGMACLSQLFETSALNRAAHLDELLENGKILSPFHGIPVLLKDNLDVKGEITHAGTQYLNRVATESCGLATQLEALGMIILGKTKMTELAFGLSGQNPVQGTPANAWSNTMLSPGGSSSGSAVAVAEGFSPLAIGGDTGGSIRTPAALNSVIGFKPSSDKITATGTVPLSMTLDTLGPMALDIDDISQLYYLLTGNCENDASHADVAVLYYLQEADFPCPLEDEVLQLWRTHLNLLKNAGFNLLPWSKPAEIDLQRLSDFTSDIIAYESYQYHGKNAENPELEMWDIVRQRILRGKQIQLSDYQTLISYRENSRKIFSESLSRQCLLFPVSPFFARALDSEDRNFTHVGEYTRPFNYLDAPGCTYPVGFSSNGLPMGLQVLAAHGEDNLVLSMVSQIMQKLSIKPSVAQH